MRAFINVAAFNLVLGIIMFLHSGKLGWTFYPDATLFVIPADAASLIETAVGGLSVLVMATVLIDRIQFEDEIVLIRENFCDYTVVMITTIAIMSAFFTIYIEDRPTMLAMAVLLLFVALIMSLHRSLSFERMKNKMNLK